MRIRVEKLATAHAAVALVLFGAFTSIPDAVLEHFRAQWVACS
jgi:hypothetical protein